MLFKVLGVEVGVESVYFVLVDCIRVELLQIGDVLVNHLVIEPLFGVEGTKIVVVDVPSVLVFYLHFIIRE